ncbi:MAG: GDSL-type esterase/lipase family protein [Bacteroidota bacterium]
MKAVRRFAIVGLLFIGIWSYAQETIPFEDEVQEIVERNDSLWDASRTTIVFTGSSSIRLWEDLQQRFPSQQVLNTGFGGSQSTDLLHHLEKLVLRYKPNKVFIYEGDNDIFEKKPPREILATTLEIVTQLKSAVPALEIVLISAKPSISRWKYRGKYKRLNKKFMKLAQQLPDLSFVDVWYPMLNGRKLRKDIFISDGLHMNTTGYDIWYEVLREYVEAP